MRHAALTMVMLPVFGRQAPCTRGAAPRLCVRAVVKDGEVEPEQAHEGADQPLSLSQGQPDTARRGHGGGDVGQTFPALFAVGRPCPSTHLQFYQPFGREALMSRRTPASTLYPRGPRRSVIAGPSGSVRSLSRFDRRPPVAPTGKTPRRYSTMEARHAASPLADPLHQWPGHKRSSD